MFMNRQRITSLHQLTAPGPSASGSSNSKVARFVVSIDIGATKSAVTAAVRFSGHSWNIIQVSCWKGQEGKDLHETKVPTVLLYDQKGQGLLACGAEALAPRMRTSAIAAGWQYVKDFKIHLHPRRHLINIEAHPLPTKIDIIRVYTDYLRYLLEHTKFQLRDCFGGRDVWGEAATQVEVVLTTPNRWGKEAQENLELAAVNAGLITSLQARNSLYFVEEGEAAARFFLLHDTSGFASTKMEMGANFLVCDAGGSTVDISSYEVTKKNSKQLRLKETAIAPDTALAGGGKVDEELSFYLKRMFSRTDLPKTKSESMISQGVRDFESDGKRSFTGARACDIIVAGEPESYPDLDINHGVLSIEPSDAVNFFKSPFDLINGALNRQISANPKIDSIILTGGFGESPYLRQLIKDKFPKKDIFMANGSTSQAISVGALLLVIGRGDVKVERIEREYQTWSTSFLKRCVRTLVGRSAT